MPDTRPPALMACPFCGAQGEDLGIFGDADAEPTCPARRIQCFGCNVEAPYYPDEEQAVAVWNTRATSPDRHKPTDVSNPAPEIDASAGRVDADDAARLQWLLDSDSLAHPGVDMAAAFHSGDDAVVRAAIDRARKD